jgi:transcriptional regulator with XRE-family HTH domain
VQDKNEVKYSLSERLKNLRLAKQWKWAEVAKALDLSEQMIYAVRAKRCGLSDKAAWRLRNLEFEAGLKGEPPKMRYPEHEASALAMHEEAGENEVELWTRRAKTAEKQLHDLKTKLRGLL